MPKRVMMLTGEETILRVGLDVAAGTVLDFWRWAFSDLQANTIRGVFAEWLVARLLDIPLTHPRQPWAPVDLVTANGVRIEVKCGAYLQSWHDDNRRSRIRWSGLAGRIWSDDGRSMSEEPSFNADLYVFCLQAEKELENWNALDISQWRFFILNREQVAGLDVKTVTEATLRENSEEMDSAEFRSRALALIQQVAGCQATSNPGRAEPMGK